MVRIVSLSKASRCPVMKELVLGATVSFEEENTWIQMRNTGFHLKAAGAWLVFQ